MNTLAKHFSLGGLLRFAAPAVGMMLVISIYTVTDGIFIGRYAGSLALAASNIVYPALNLVFRKLSERNQQVLQDRILELLSGSAQDCYVSFSKHYPQLIHRLPQTQIAAFLGITPEFFSKMKAQLLRQ